MADATPPPTRGDHRGVSARLGIIAVLYFAQGLPFGLFVEAVPVWLRQAGVSLADIGWLTLLQLPWSFKPLLGPLVDRLGSARQWIVPCLIALAVAAFAIGTFAPATLPFGLLAALLALTMASGTQDIAIDASFVRLLPAAEQGRGNGLRVSAYRVAMIAGGGATVMLAGTLAWSTVFGLVALLFLILAALVSRLDLPAAESQEDLRAWARSLILWLRRPGAAAALGFILLYKLGDAAMGPMVRPFWVDRGMSLESIGLWTTTIGMLATIGGALLGGQLVSRHGVFFGLWALGGFQALSNLVYAAVAFLSLPVPALYAASLFESFAAGLGTAALLSFLSTSCDRQHAATQYAVLSALFGLTRTLAGAFSGLGVEGMGYGPFFAFTFLLALPAYALLPLVRRWLAWSGSAPGVA